MLEAPTVGCVGAAQLFGILHPRSCGTKAMRARTVAPCADLVQSSKMQRCVGGVRAWVRKRARARGGQQGNQQGNQQRCAHLAATMSDAAVCCAAR